MPTVTHMSILKLIQEGYCKYLISQNTDGLHRKSGVPPELLSELHGNSNLETCEKCKKEYLRDYRVRCAKKVHDHYTGRKCVCGGKLKDSIINFSESLPEIPMEKGFKHANKADLCLVLGSSLTVSPACEMPGNCALNSNLLLETVAKNGNNLVICNLQKTPYDSDACLRIFGKTDDVMKLVMQELGLDIPKWKLVRRVLIGHEKGRLYVRGIEPDGTPATIFKKVEIEKLTLQQEPFEVSDTVAKEGTDVKITLHFFGHYNEPSIKLKHKLKRHQYVLYKLEYDPFTRTWEIDLNEKK